MQSDSRVCGGGTLIERGRTINTLGGRGHIYPRWHEALPLKIYMLSDDLVLLESLEVGGGGGLSGRGKKKKIFFQKQG